MAACVRRGLGGLREFGRWPAGARGSVSRACPGPAPVPGPPAPRAGPSRPQPGRREPPAGCTGHAQTAARSRRERASAPPARATYLGARRPRMLQVWAAETSAGRAGAQAEAIGDTRGATPPPPRPGRGGHAGGLAGRLAAPGLRATSGIRGEGGVQARITWRGWGGAGAGAAQDWAFRTRRRGRGRALQTS